MDELHFDLREPRGNAKFGCFVNVAEKRGEMDKNAMDGLTANERTPKGKL